MYDMLYMIRFILQNDAFFAVLEVLAAVILVTFFFASAQNPGIIPRNESIPQEPNAIFFVQWNEDGSTFAGAIHIVDF